MPQFNLAGLADNPALTSQFEAQVGLLGTLSLRACDTLQRLSALHMQLAHALVDDTLAACLEILSCNDPMHMAATAMRRLQPVGERLGHYQQQLMDVIGQAHADLPSASPSPAPPSSLPATKRLAATNPRPAQARATMPPPAPARATSPPPVSAKATSPPPVSAKATNPAPASAKTTNPRPAPAKATNPRPAPARATSPPPAAAQPGGRRSPESRKS